MDTTTAPAAPQNSSLGNAAARTFAVPELLESILFHLVSAAVPKRCWFEDLSRWSDGHLKGLALSLFQLQRVSHAFRDTIQGSSQLQRRMLITPVGKDCYDLGASEDGKYAPIIWFMRSILDATECFWDNYSDDIDIDIDNIQTRQGDAEQPENFAALRKAHDSFLAKGCASPSASWRRIKLGPTGYTKVIGLGFIVWVGHPPASDNADDAFVQWEFKAEDTLSDLFEKWSGMIKVVERQARRYKLLQARRNKENQELFDLDTEELNALSMPYSEDQQDYR